MSRALVLARRGKGKTNPNPMVGAVLVVRGRIVGEGFHKRAGDPHAEINAIEAASGRCAGSTLYVTLEPCVHHGRTPPCVEAIVAAGVESVVVAMLDPDERVRGKGVKALRKAGLQVEVGDGQHDAAILNRSYIMQRSQGRPFVTYKAAVSLDGRTAAVNGSSRWISGDASRSDVHRLRAA
ncbi:MAG TPA: bifunctional diaminohydroxyphosphoribosylaminopyrimidine deaminase/5-amino-6-(5-phosphoribosylamino)uracil reductase RibD, partial [Actinomycetota bacterium]|nr:bifunctional diaminohydroxyphosphoribosylaminopyrimidine deaminase/5-amino-6-(5-phosphoribosylamino)uracil reductase RibD [Actinomycetota bacterium]